jgi:hypothetical protein
VSVTATFRLLYVFVVIEHGSRGLVRAAVTRHPTAAWALQQLREVVGFERAREYLIHDRDSIFDPEGLGTRQAARLDSGIRRTRGGRFRARQRSWLVCMLSHISALVPSAPSRRSAIDALTPARPFSSAERACRVTPRRFATSPIDSPSGRFSRRTSPGCAGLCMLTVHLILVELKAQ